MASKQVFLVVGSGPGIGAHAASLFAARKFPIIAIVSRDYNRLLQDRDTVLAAAKDAGKEVQVETYSCDIRDRAAFEERLGEVKLLGTLSAVLFNAARVAPSQMFEFGEEEIVEDFMTTTIALYTTARWAIPLLQNPEVETPSFLVTSGLLHDHPVPILFSLSLVKASQRTLVLSLQMTYPDIHIALLYIDGAVSLQEKKNNPANIAENLWKLYSQKKENWTKDLTV